MINSERGETKTASDTFVEDGQFIHSLSINVEYYRSLEYCLKWKAPMYPKRSSSKLQKDTKRCPERNPSPDEEVIQRKLRSKKQKTWLRKSKAGEKNINSGKREYDIIDIINRAHRAEEDEGGFAEAGVDEDEADEDCVSVTSSVASGPSILYHTTSSQVRCSACQKLYMKVKRMKTRIKNKLLDKDPKSLTCDQWILMKKRRPRRLPNTEGKLSVHIQLVKRRLKLKVSVKKQYVGESSSCSRPLIFLQRNLRLCVREAAKQEEKQKNKRGKRTRGDSQGSRVAKQQRLQSNARLHHIGTSCTNDRSLHAVTSRSGFEEGSDEEIDNQADSNLTVKLSPPMVTMETTRNRELPHKQKTAKRTKGFRDLLVQLRSNSSMIVRETR